MSKRKGKRSIIISSVASAGGSLMALASGDYLATKLGPFAGTAVVAALGDVTKRVISDFAERFLSSREKERVEATFKNAIEKIKYNQDAGYTLRSDGFFDSSDTGSSDADEILEAVLIKAKNESEEKKTKYLGNIFANVAFRPDVSKSLAGFCIKTVELLSYQQLCFLALVAKVGVLHVETLRNRDHSDPDLEVLKKEEMALHITDLGTLGLIKGTGSWTDTLSVLGRVFFELANLEDIPEKDLDSLKGKLDLCEDSLVQPC